MALATDMRKSRSINDYPEHLNPFRDEDNHRGIRFWTLSRKSGRNNSFSLNNIKDLRNTWSLKSFMRKKKKGQEIAEDSINKAQVNEEPSPVQFRRAIQYRSCAGRSAERYEYAGSVTPLPRSRFQERVRTTPPPNNTSPNNFTYMTPGRASFSHRSGEAYPLPGLTRSEAGNSSLSVATVGSTNPFEDDVISPQVPARRRKKRAPLPPTANNSVASANTSAASVEEQDKSKSDDITIDDTSLNIELKIVEEADEKPKTSINMEESPKLEVTNVSDSNFIEKGNEKQKSTTITDETQKLKAINVIETKVKEVPDVNNSPHNTEVILSTVNVENADATNNNIKKDSTPNSSVELKSKDLDLSNTKEKDVVFEKVNIRLYRRNSSLGSDDKQNGNIELSPNNKRCKSLSNNVNVTFATYDIPLHIDEENNEIRDMNDNQQAPQKVVCKLLNADEPRKYSGDNSISSTEREFIEIDRATRELEQEISKLNSYRYMDDFQSPRKSNGKSVSEIKSRFENSARYSPNPIPKPRRSPRAGSTSPVSQPSD